MGTDTVETVRDTRRCTQALPSPAAAMSRMPAGGKKKRAGPLGTVKQVIVIRRDLRMRRGKEIAQGAHASGKWLSERLAHVADWPDDLFLVHLTEPQRLWLEGKFTKIVVTVQSEEELFSVYEKALNAEVTVFMIEDAGNTEFHGVPTFTAVAVGPDWAEKIDGITGDLKLY